MREKLSERHRHIMRHALGLNQAGYEYRNYYAAGASDIPDWEFLVSLGFAERGQRNKLTTGYCVTDAGHAALKDSRHAG